MTPDWLVERLAAGELSPEKAAEVRRRLEAENGLHRLAALESSNRELLERVPPGPAVGEIRRRARGAESTRSPLHRWAPVAGLVAAALMAGLVVTSLPHEDTREKGLRPQLIVHRLRGNTVEVVASGAEAAKGDVLQLGYVAAGRSFGAIVSVDGRGQVTRHLPITGDDAAALPGNGEVLLPTAYSLDDAPRFERFVLLTAPHAFSLQSLTTWSPTPDAAQSQRLPLPDFVEQTELSLRKVSR